MCGIVAPSRTRRSIGALRRAPPPAAPRQDAAGIVTNDGTTFHLHKGAGYVRDVFRTRNMRDLTGNLGIGHCRYPTGGRVVRARVAAFLRQLAVRHHACAQRQPDEQRGAETRALPARLPSRQHQFRFGGAAQRAGARARTRGAPRGSTRTRSSLQAYVHAAAAALTRSSR